MEPLPRPAERVSTSLVTFDLTTELAALRESKSYRQNDHASTTLVNRGGFGAVLVALPRRGHLKEHTARRGITIHVLEGAVRVELEEGPLELHATQVAALAPNMRHGVIGIEDSAFLLTMGGEVITSDTSRQSSD